VRRVPVALYQDSEFWVKIGGAQEKVVRISIIGLGLIGGSLGLALRSALQDCIVTGWDRTHESGVQAQARGAVDEVAPSLAEAVRPAELVVIATPVMAVRPILEMIAPHLKEGAIITDVASTKTHVLEWAQAVLPSTVSFVGGHPMAGSERHGIEHARADLFRDAVYCLTPLAGAATDALETLESLVVAIGARPQRIDAMTHDAYVAAVSHLPFVVSAALVHQAANAPAWPEMQQLAATGFRDLTRLASGDPSMHMDICLTNSAAIAAQLHELARFLDEFAEHLQDTEFLARFFELSREQREQWLHNRQSR
jgi:prephenate dehydrogenase